MSVYDNWTEWYHCSDTVFLTVPFIFRETVSLHLRTATHGARLLFQQNNDSVRGEYWRILRYPTNDSIAKGDATWKEVRNKEGIETRWDNEFTGDPT